MELTDLSDQNIPVVNEMLQKAFSSRVAGNFKNGIELPLSRGSRLNVIVNRRYFGFHKVIGQFECEDGSSIRVLPEYSASAVIYAEMYEVKFGKKVNITLDPNADCVGVG